jgi:hypothetical protein
MTVFDATPSGSMLNGVLSPPSYAVRVSSASCSFFFLCSTECVGYAGGGR